MKINLWPVSRFLRRFASKEKKITNGIEFDFCAQDGGKTCDYFSQ